MGYFRVRDLMINVMPEGGQAGLGCIAATQCVNVSLPDCVGQTLACPAGTQACGISLCAGISRCVGVTLPWGGGGVGACDAGACSLVPCSGDCTHNYCSVTGSCEKSLQRALTPEAHLQELAQLKEQLSRQLADVEERERALGEALQPTTLDEVNVLEAKLEAALEEVRARKSELDPGGGG
jgi:hypothetical protein